MSSAPLAFLRTQSGTQALIVALFNPLAHMFILAHPGEYRLMLAGLFFRPGEPRPSFELMKRRSAELLGGSPEDHADLVLALLALVYGTATLMIANAIPQGYEKKLHPVIAEAVELLVNPAALSVGK